MKNWKALCSLAFATALLAACGGGGGGSSSTGAAATPVVPTATFAGTLTDAPVAGAKYVTSSGSGGCTASAPCTTGAQGQFNYASGDTVSFSAAGVTLGTTPALKPASDGTTTVTPVSLVQGASSPTDPGPTAIAQFLQTLSNVAARTSGSGASGVLTMPTDSATMTALASAMTGAGVTASTSVATAVSKMQSVMDSAFGANQFTVVPPATAQAALTQGVNSDGIVGTVWTGSCTCGGGATLYFQPGGVLTGFTFDGGLLAGTWSGSSTSGGGVSVQATSSGGGSGSGTIAANSSTGTINVMPGGGGQAGTLSITKVSAPSTAAPANTQYMGGWYATYTPNAAALAAGNSGGSAYLVAAPDGSFYGITDGNAGSFNGTWTPATGQGSASWTNSKGEAIAIAVNLANASGTVSMNGQAAGSLSFSRTGTLSRNVSQNGAGTSSSLLLNVVVSWANTGGNAVTSLALGLNAYDSNGKLVASGVRSESAGPSTLGVRTSTFDNIAVSYPTGGASTYSLSAGGVNCTLAGASGSVNDANSGKAGAYPTVYVTCDPGAAVQTIPLLLNVSTSWGTVYPMPGYGLSLTVKDASGNPIGTAFLQQNVNLMGMNGMVTATTTTNNIAVSYPKGSGVTYSLSPGVGPGAYCSISAGGSGSVVDANSGNAGAYPTVSVSCP